MYIIDFINELRTSTIWCRIVRDAREEDESLPTDYTPNLFPFLYPKTGVFLMTNCRDLFIYTNM
jgi:hypothetical protein